LSIELDLIVRADPCQARGRSHHLQDDVLLKYDVDVSWWVTPDAYERGYYTKLLAALRHWIEMVLRDGIPAGRAVRGTVLRRVR
jgi:hypothetical protein